MDKHINITSAQREILEVALGRLEDLYPFLSGSKQNILTVTDTNEDMFVAALVRYRSQAAFRGNRSVASAVINKIVAVRKAELPLAVVNRSASEIIEDLQTALEAAQKAAAEIVASLGGQA